MKGVSILTPLEQAFKIEVEDTLASKNIQVENEYVINQIINDLVSSSDEMWDCIIARILEVSGKRIQEYLEGKLD